MLGGLSRMKDDETGSPLSRRVPGSTRSGPSQRVSRDLSDTDVGRIQAAIDAEHATAEMPSRLEPNTEPIPVVTDDVRPGTTQTGNPPVTAERTAKRARATKAPGPEEPLGAARALRAAAELRAAEDLLAAEAPRAAQPTRGAQPTRAEAPPSAAGRLRPEEPVVTQEPPRAPGPVAAPEPVRAEAPVVPPEPARPAEPVRAPEPVGVPEPVRAEAPVVAPEQVRPAEPVGAPEPPRIPEPPRPAWPPAELGSGTIGWLWPEDSATGPGGPRYRPRSRPGRSDQWTASDRSRYSTAMLAAVGVVVLLAGGIAIGMALRGHTASPSAGATTGVKPRADANATVTPARDAAPSSRPHFAPAPGGALGNAMGQASAWAVHQVAQGTTLACDPQMCSSLVAAGFPPSQEAAVAANSQSLSGASLVAVTPRLRQVFQAHPSFAADVAPVVLASFSSGRAVVTIQPVDAAGGAAYQAAFGKDVQARIAVGNQLLNSGKVFAAPKAKRALEAGDVDPRILLAIQALIRQLPSVKIAAFSNSGPDASPGVPFRMANFVAVDLSAGEPTSAYFHQLIAVLRTAATFPPVWHATPITMFNGQTAVQIVYAAPSPLGGG